MANRTILLYFPQFAQGLNSPIFRAYPFALPATVADSELREWLMNGACVTRNNADTRVALASASPD